jgi:hypothetical protein
VARCLRAALELRCAELAVAAQASAAALAAAEAELVGLSEAGEENERLRAQLEVLAAELAAQGEVLRAAGRSTALLRQEVRASWRDAVLTRPCLQWSPLPGSGMLGTAQMARYRSLACAWAAGDAQRPTGVPLLRRCRRWTAS